MKSNAKPFQPPRRTSRSPSTMRRVMPRMIAQVRSAVASVSTSGVLVTTTPRARAAATSMLLYPTATVATIFRSDPASSTAASTGSVNIVTSACLPRTRSASASRVSGSPSWSSTSHASSSRAIARAGRRRVTRTAGCHWRSARGSGLWLWEPEPEPGAGDRRLMSVRLADSRSDCTATAGSMRHGPSASIPVGSTNCAWLRWARRTRPAGRRRRRPRLGRRALPVARDGVAYQRAQFLFGHSCTSTLSTMPMMAASTGAPLRPSASPAARPSSTISTRSVTPAPTESTASSVAPRGVSSSVDRLHKEELGALERAVLLRGDDRPDHSRQLHRAWPYSTSQWSTMPTTPASAGTSTG